MSRGPNSSVKTQITVKHLFTVPPFTVPLHFIGPLPFPKYRVYVKRSVNCNSIHRAPLGSVLLCLPPRGTSNGDLTVPGVEMPDVLPKYLYMWNIINIKPNNRKVQTSYELIVIALLVITDRIEKGRSYEHRLPT